MKAAYIVVPRVKTWPNVKTWKTSLEAEEAVAEEINAMKLRYKDYCKLGWNEAMIGSGTGRMEIGFDVLEIPTPD